MNVYFTDHKLCIHFQKYPYTPGKGLFFRGLKILKVSQTSHRDSGLAPKSENHSLGPVPCSRVCFSPTQNARPRARKGPEFSLCFQILSNLEDSQKTRKGVNYSGTKPGVLISSEVRMKYLMKATVLGYREQLKWPSFLHPQGPPRSAP